MVRVRLRCFHQSVCDFRTVVLFVCLHASAVVLAQSPIELRKLLFHAAPLTDSGTNIFVHDYASRQHMRMPFEEERVDMARFEEVTAEDSAQSYEHSRSSDWLFDRPHDPDQSEVFLDAALQYQRRENHEEALASLELAAAASRIQYGPWSEQQIRLTEHAIVSLSALRRSEELALKHAVLLELYGRVHGPGSPLTAHAMLQVAQSRLAKLNPAASRIDPDVLESTQTLLVDAIRILVEHEAWTDPALFELELGLIRSYYLDACQKELLVKAGACAAGTPSTRARLRTRANRLASPKQYSDGKRAYLRMIGYLKKDPDASIDTISDVMAGLGDWHLVFGQPDEAASQYKKLAKLLSLAGIPAAEADALVRPRLPVALPAFMSAPLSSPALPLDTAILGYIDVDFEIGNSGSISRLDVLNTSPGTSPVVVDHLVSVLRNTRFRPGSGAEAANGIRYYFSR